ncbi:MAG TPA: iron-sulfur cluster assembly protein [Inquilinus sp.]|jgi:FeS assembly SUF system protein|uniref:iron-sulfur cluster assembly protein n=1 Tax=Inquilinus sp. TaxID=1932117 RepID=UPI001C8F29E0|nr:iron-sulfur cluster assembly protein [Mycobacterium sp. KBS0706]
MSSFPDDGLGLHDFMRAGTLDLPEPDWIHVRTPLSKVSYPLDVEATRSAVMDNLTLVFDPELPVNIVELGLIYRVDVSPDGKVGIDMTLTAPNCPVAGSMPVMVERGALSVPGVTEAKVTLTWDPPWSIERASEDARLALGM